LDLDIQTHIFVLFSQAVNVFYGPLGFFFDVIGGREYGSRTRIPSVAIGGWLPLPSIP
jgi:hypothetical protein